MPPPKVSKRTKALWAAQKRDHQRRLGEGMSFKHDPLKSPNYWVHVWAVVAYYGGVGMYWKRKDDAIPMWGSDKWIRGESPAPLLPTRTLVEYPPSGRTKTILRVTGPTVYCDCEWGYHYPNYADQCHFKDHHAPCNLYQGWGIQFGPEKWYTGAENHGPEGWASGLCLKDGVIRCFWRPEEERLKIVGMAKGAHQPKLF